jgi:hypothetical protein
VGLLRSKTYVEATVVNGVLLGQPVIVNERGETAGPGDDLNQCWWGWDDQRIPSGVLGDDGEITPDETSD